MVMTHFSRLGAVTLWMAGVVVHELLGLMDIKSVKVLMNFLDIFLGVDMSGVAALKI